MNKIYMLFKQFRMLDAVKISFVEIFRKIFDKYRVASYSQAGDDCIIDFYLNGKSKIIYVDIGCNMPFQFSNTMKFYQRGSTGLAVDANPEVIKQYSKYRPNDISICACVSNSKGKSVLFVPEHSAMGSISNEFKSQYMSDGVKEFLVENISGNELFEKYAIPDKFDLLSVDVEGHDFSVLQSINFHKYRPFIIIVEMHKIMDFKDLFETEIFKYLKNYSYKLVAFSSMNAFFLDQNV
jgi:FkbM family methyltransferase